MRERGNRQRAAGGARTGLRCRLLRYFNLERLLGLALLGLALTLYVLDPYALQYVHAKTFDFYQRWNPRPIPALEQKPVTIIDIDEASLAELGQWPWPRTVVAQLVHNLTAMGASLVAFDVVFAEPDRTNPDRVARSIVGIDDETRRKLAAAPSNDEALAQVMKRSRVVLGQAGQDERPASVSREPLRKSVALKGPPPHDYLTDFKWLVRNIPILEKVAVGHGIFSLGPEPDGIVRRVPMLMEHGGDLYPALSLEMLRIAVARPTILVETDATGVRAVKVTRDLQVPTDRFGRAWPYFSRLDPSKYVSALDVLKGTANRALIQNRMALIGTSAVGLKDVRSTPVQEFIPGVDVHAQVLENVVQGTFLKRPAAMIGAERLLIFAGGILMMVLVPAVSARWTVGVLLAVVGAAAGTSWYLFTEERMLLEVGYGILTMILIYTVMTYVGHVRAETQRRQVRSAFSHYLSPAMVERLAEEPDRLKLGGESRRMTMLFCDVRGFTTISEQFDAEGLTALINRLLTPLTAVILEHGGTVDKYMGDCIMAFWNAPMDDPEHAANACRAALAMNAAMADLNDRLAAEAEAEERKPIPLKIGIGLNSGQVVVGNMGSDQRFDYSVLGDAVNLASRLEGQCKTYGVDIVIGENTRDLVFDLAVLELDLIRVKGKAQAVRIFTVLGEAETAAGQVFGDLAQAHGEMLEAYRGQRWAEARRALAACREKAASFNLAAFHDLYETRIGEFENAPPPADWDGVYIALTK